MAMAKEKKHDMREGMWERGPVELDGGRQEALQQERENIDPDNPKIVSPGSVQAPGQTTSN
jgi:hypothetical protein